MVAAIRESRPGQPEWRYVSGVAEESGEFIQAYNRLTGTSRRPGTRGELITELAQVVTTCWLAARILNLELQVENIAPMSTRLAARFPEEEWVLQVQVAAGKFTEAYLAPGPAGGTAWRIMNRLEGILTSAYAAAAALGIALDDAVTIQFSVDTARGWRTTNA